MDESFYEKGLKEYNKENYLHAFACFENSVKHEKYPDSYYYLAEIYFKNYKDLDLLSSNINLSFLYLIKGINESSELCLQAFIKYFILEYEKVDFLSDCILLFLKHYKKEIDTKLRLDLFNIIDFWFNKERKANKPPKQILKNINLFIENSNDKFIKTFLKAKINEIKLDEPVRLSLLKKAIHENGDLVEILKNIYDNDLNAFLDDLKEYSPNVCMFFDFFQKNSELVSIFSEKLDEIAAYTINEILSSKGNELQNCITLVSAIKSIKHINSINISCLLDDSCNYLLKRSQYDDVINIFKYLSEKTSITEGDYINRKENKIIFSNLRNVFEVQIICYIRIITRNDSNKFEDYYLLRRGIFEKTIVVPNRFSPLLKNLYKKCKSTRLKNEIQRIICQLENEKIVNEIFEENNDEYITYNKIFSDMDKGDHSIFNYAKYFWQVTSLNNLISIINEGFFLSRNKLIYRKFDDLRKLSTLSNEVQNHNLSTEIFDCVRFYLRPSNKPLFAIKNIYKKIFGNDGYVTIAIDRNALKESIEDTFLTSKNGSRSESYMFRSYGNKFNGHKSEYFKAKVYKDLNFEEIYSKYEPGTNNSEMQQAEFLVKNRLPIKFIKKIYFLSEDAKYHFLNSIIINVETYTSIKNKCVVKKEYEFGE